MSVNSVVLPDELISYIDEWKHKKGSLIMILHAVQDVYGYVPKDICFNLAKELKVPLARIYEVLTFYNYFKLNAPSKYVMSICFGTACYLKGAPELLNVIKEKLNINDKNESEDGLFTIKDVRCLGCCGLAPVIMINGKVFGKLDKEKMIDIIEQYQKEGVL